MANGARYSYTHNHANRNMNSIGIRHAKRIQAANPTHATTSTTATALSKTADALPPLQSLIATTDAVALRFGLRRFADGYGGYDDSKHGHGHGHDNSKHGRGFDSASQASAVTAVDQGNPHISLAWTLQKPPGLSSAHTLSSTSTSTPASASASAQPSLVYPTEPCNGIGDASANGNGTDDESLLASLRREYAALITRLGSKVVVFREVKVKIGRDVCGVRLRASRAGKTSRATRASRPGRAVRFGSGSGSGNSTKRRGAGDRDEVDRNGLDDVEVDVDGDGNFDNVDRESGTATATGNRKAKTEHDRSALDPEGVEDDDDEEDEDEDEDEEEEENTMEYAHDAHETEDANDASSYGERSVSILGYVV